MSTTRTARFAVLSDITSEADVFDNLIEVINLDTDEAGLLLCSHFCKWPQELFGQADFLEGCSTPSHYAQEPRLVLGYHPSSLTSWKYEQKENYVELTLSTTIWGSDPAVDNSVDFWYRINTYHYNTIIFPPRQIRWLNRTWRRTEGRQGIDRLRAYYASVDGLIRQGVLIPIVACSYMPPEMVRCYYEVAPNHTRGFVDPVVRHHCMVYYNLLEVCETNEAEGYAEPVWLDSPEAQEDREVYEAERHRQWAIRSQMEAKAAFSPPL